MLMLIARQHRILNLISVAKNCIYMICKNMDLSISPVDFVMLCIEERYAEPPWFDLLFLFRFGKIIKLAIILTTSLQPFTRPLVLKL